MIKKLSLLLLILFVGSFMAHAQLKIGDVAPDITITHWLKNAPRSKDLKGKFIVIDFWATWCAPCLESVPHFNKIVNNNRSRSNLVFLALTDEKANKVSPILKRFPFSAIVVADTSGQTSKNFKLSSIPFCVVIDDENRIRWFGNTADLTDELLQQIIARKLVPELKKKQLLPEDAMNMYKGLSLRYTNYMEDKDLKEYFSMEPINFHKLGSTWGLPGWKEMVIGDSLIQRFAKLLDVGESQISLPPDLIGACISYCYKSPVINPKVGVLDTIVNVMKLKYTKTDSLMDVIQLEISNKKILEKTFTEPLPDVARASWSNDYAAIYYDSFSNLTDHIQEKFRKTVIIKPDSILNHKLTLTIKMDNIKSLITSFNIYGIKTTLIKKVIPVYKFTHKR